MVVNRALTSLHEGSLDITRTVPLDKKLNELICNYTPYTLAT